MNPATLYGGVEIEVRFQNAEVETRNAEFQGPSGTDSALPVPRSALVKVRQLPLRLMPAYHRVKDNEAESIELFCDKPAGWADTLTPESFEAVLAKGEELNLDFLSSYSRRKANRMEKIAPGAEQKIVKELLAQMMPQLGAQFGITAPKPPSSVT